ncbi:hypothetical protein PVAP13_7KG121470, partial [Panicum virgatum]
MRGGSRPPPPPPPPLPDMRVGARSSEPVAPGDFGRASGRAPRPASAGDGPPPLRRRRAASSAPLPPFILPSLHTGRMHETEVPDWIDPTNACRVVIDVSSYSTVEEDRSMYKKGRRLDWWVDADEYSIIDMEKDVLEHFSWGSYQEANFWYVGQNKETFRLGSDQELLTLLRGTKKVEFIMTVDRCVHVDMALTVTEMENERQVSVQENHVPDRLEDESQVSVEENQVADLDGLEWALEPQLGVTAAGPSRVVEEGNHDLDPDVDHEGDDPVGADEEWRYFKKKMHVQGEGSNEKVQQEKKKVDSKKSVTEDIDPEAV